MAKADYQKEVEIIRLKKENTSLKNKIETFADKIKELEQNYNSSDSSKIETLSLKEIKLTSNIRDDYQYEQIEELAKNILENGQLQPVLVTNDNYLLAGYRRYYAIKLLFENPEIFSFGELFQNGELFIYKVKEELKDLGYDKVERIQLSENEQRRSIDNFQLSKLFSKYLSEGFSQKYISDKFKKTKSFVSSIISLQNIDGKLVKWLKEFQIYSWSKEKFTMVNKKNFSEKDFSFYAWNDTVICFCQCIIRTN